MEWQAEIKAGNADGAEAEAGDLLFSIINVLRLLKVNPEVALNRTCEKFVARMEYMEKTAQKGLYDVSASELNNLWDEAKKIIG